MSARWLLGGGLGALAVAAAAQEVVAPQFLIPVGSVVDASAGGWTPVMAPEGVSPIMKADVLGAQMGAVIPAGAIPVAGLPPGAIPVIGLPPGAIPAGGLPPGAIPASSLPPGAIVVGNFPVGRPAPIGPAPAPRPAGGGSGPPASGGTEAAGAELRRLLDAGARSREDAETLRREEERLRWAALLLPGKPVLREALAGNLTRQGRDAEAYSELKAAVDAGSIDPQTLLLRAAVAHRLGKLKDSNADAAAVLKMLPGNAQATTLYRLTAGRGEAAAPPAAASAGKPPAMEPAPDYSRPPRRDLAAGAEEALERARLALRIGDSSEAARVAQGLAARDPADAQALHLAAAASLQAGKFAEAARQATAVLALRPLSAPALNVRALAYNRLGRFEEGLADAVQALAVRAGDPAGFRNKAFAEAGLGRRAEALASLKAAAESNPAFREEYESAARAKDLDELLFLFTGASSGPRRPERWGAWLGLCLGGPLLAWLALRRAGRRGPLLARPWRLLGFGGRSKAFLERYEFLRAIGGGGMGLVFEGVDRALGRRVAVKQMRSEIRSDPRARERFLIEAKAVAALRHPHIVTIHAIEEEGEDVFLVFEFIDGTTLHDRLRRRGRLNLSEALGVFEGIAAALEYAHSRNVIHRDLKPMNIMLDRAGTAKLMDFGFAHRSEDSGSEGALTQHLYGTLRYVSPEQALGKVCRESDVYSLGATLYEALTAATIFEGATAAEISARKLARGFTPVSRLVCELPRELDEFFARALEPDLEKRHRSVRELWDAFREVASSHGIEKS